MKKIVVITVILMMIITLICGCARMSNHSESNKDIVVKPEVEDGNEIANNKEIIDLDVYLYKYNAMTGSISEYYKYDENGKRTTKKCYAKDGSIESVVEYDAYGNEVKRTDSESGIVTEFKYEYDTDGKKIIASKYENEVYIGKYEYEYDANNHLVKENFYDKEGNIESFYDYSYNSEGLLARKSTTTYTDIWETYKYDDNGNLIETSCIRGDSILFWEFYEYDEKGNLFIHTYWDGEKKEMEVYSYVKTSFGDYVKNEAEYENIMQIPQEKMLDKSKVCYAGVLAEYKIMEKSYFNTINLFTNVNELFYQFYQEPESLYYTLIDLNNDGIEELIVAEDTSSNSISGGTVNTNNKIYDIFTYDGVSAKKIVDAQERIIYWVCENGYIKCKSSGGAYYNDIKYYTLSEKDAILLLVAGAKQEDIAYFEITPGREQIITREEYEAFYDMYPENTTLEWIKINDE